MYVHIIELYVVSYMVTIPQHNYYVHNFEYMYLPAWLTISKYINDMLQLSYAWLTVMHVKHFNHVHMDKALYKHA